MDSQVQHILDFLNRERLRATYGAVAEALGIPAQSVGGRLGVRRPEASWVVSADSGEPTGYKLSEKHAGLHEKSEIVKSGKDLLRRMRGG